MRDPQWSVLCLFTGSPFPEDDKSRVKVEGGSKGEIKQLVQGHAEVIGKIIGCLKIKNSGNSSVFRLDPHISGSDDAAACPERMSVM